MPDSPSSSAYPPLTSQGFNCEESIKKVKTGDLSMDAGYIYYEIFDVNKDEKNLGTVEIRPLLNCLDQESNLLIRTLKEKYFTKGTGNPYRLHQKFEDIEHPSQTKDINELVFDHLPPIKDGFFIEAGAYDSEWHSVSLYFEKVYNWTGLLIEAKETDHNLGLEKNRRAIYVNSCLGLKQHPHFSYLDFNPPIKGTGIAAMPGLSENATHSGVKMQCLPLYSLIQAAGNPTVNLLILDVEGAEYGILKTLPWDKVDIQVMTVETDLVGTLGVSGGSQEEIRKFIISKGYRMYKHRNNWNSITGKENNDLFVREDLVKKWNIKELNTNSL